MRISLRNSLSYFLGMLLLSQCCLVSSPFLNRVNLIAAVSGFTIGAITEKLGQFDLDADLSGWWLGDRKLKIDEILLACS